MNDSGCVSEQMKQINLSMLNNIRDLTVLIDEAGTFLESQSLPGTTVYRANLVLEEVLTNIVKYAFQDSSVHEISVLLAVKDTYLVIRFVDDGREFDPLAVPSPVMKASIEDISVGGLGVHLVRKSVDEIQYSRDRYKNVLETRISLAP
ncbi:MAG: ATP-binding protein [Desulfomonilaceae bacterium]